MRRGVWFWLNLLLEGLKKRGFLEQGEAEDLQDVVEIGMKARCSQGLIEHLTQTLFIRSNEQWTVYRYP